MTDKLFGPKYNIPSSPSYNTSKTITFTGAAGLGAIGTVAIFTVTGTVEVLKFVPMCTTTITENPVPGTSTIKIGVTGSTALFIAATTATGITSGKFWISTTPTANGLAIPAAMTNIAIATNIIATVATSVITGGAIRFDLQWRPISPNGNIS